MVTDFLKKDGFHFRIITTTTSRMSTARRAIITTPTVIPPISPTLAPPTTGAGFTLGGEGFVGFIGLDDVTAGPLVGGPVLPTGQSGDLRVSSEVPQVGSR